MITKNKKKAAKKAKPSSVLAASESDIPVSCDEMANGPEAISEEDISIYSARCP